MVTDSILSSFKPKQLKLIINSKIARVQRIGSPTWLAIL